MAQARIGHDIGAGQKGVAVEKTQAFWLDGTADENRLLFESFGQIGHQRFANFILRGPVEDEPESPFGVMLANQNHGSMEKGAVQFSAIQDDLPLQRCVLFSHLK